MPTPTSPTANDPRGGALARFVGDRDRFVREHWGRAPLYRPVADPSAFADLFSLGDVDHILSSTTPRHPAFRMVRDGRQLDPRSYTRSGRVGGQPVHDLADPGRVYEQFHAGATIVLQSLHRFWPPLTRLARDLESALTHPVQVNAYVTPPASRGLGVHRDTHEVFVLQVHGRKLWQVWDAAVPFPLGHQTKLPPGAEAPTEAPLVEAELAPGDCLYVPRGFRHAARTAETASLHLTVGMLTYNWNDLLREVLDLATEESWFREGLPVGFADDPAALEASLAERVAELRRFLDKVDLTRVAERAVNRFWTNRAPMLQGQLRQLLTLDELDEATVLERRPGTTCRLRVTGDRLELLLGDRTLTMPAGLEPALRQVVAADRLTPADLAGHLDGPSRLVLVRRLVREGLLQPTAVG
ncbi:MAG TPA: cupin domain-containing protein [Actinomycetota bacterium]|nr:cupin domain-containing protein [Actinomycetota bacterium]